MLTGHQSQMSQLAYVVPFAGCKGSDRSFALAAAGHQNPSLAIDCAQIKCSSYDVPDLGCGELVHVQPGRLHACS